MDAIVEVRQRTELQIRRSPGSSVGKGLAY